MKKEISHSRQEETPEAKAIWFQSLTLEERMDMLCFFTNLVLENNPDILKTKDDFPSLTGPIRILSKK